MAKYDGKITDAIVSSRHFQTIGMKTNFWLADNVEFLEFGLPRNEIFFKKKKSEPQIGKLENYMILALMN